MLCSIKSYLNDRGARRSCGVLVAERLVRVDSDVITCFARWLTVRNKRIPATLVACVQNGYFASKCNWVYEKACISAERG